MGERIAVVLDERDCLAAFAGVAQLVVFEKVGEAWERRLALAWHTPSDAATLRAAVQAMVRELGGCQALLCAKVSGIAYQELNRLGFALFEAPKLADSLLDRISQDLADARQESQAQAVLPTQPVSPNGDGHYFLDLVTLQRERPEISSKKALRRFLEEEDFLSLTLVCKHLPPWTDEVMSRRGLTESTQRLDDQRLRIVIVPNSAR